MSVIEIIHIARLLAYRQLGILTVDEETDLKKWLEADECNVHLTEGVQRPYFFTDKQKEVHLFESLSAYRQVRDRKRHYLSRRRFRRKMAGLAAVLVLAVGVSLIWLSRSRPYRSDVSHRMEFLSGGSRAVLTFADGRQVELTNSLTDSVLGKEQVRLDVQSGELSYTLKGLKLPSSAYHILEVPRKGEFRLVLSDGTRVWINSDSRLKYPVAFGDTLRKVFLEGEAYFEVSPDADVPFVVDMGKAAIRVLGTSFNARAYGDEPEIFATLAEGSIMLQSAAEDMVLYPRDQGIVVRRSGQMTKRKVELSLYTGWKDGRFVFQEQNLEEIMKTLARWYDIRFSFADPEVKEVSFSGDLKRYENFDQIVDMLEMTGMAHFELQNDTIVITR